MRASVAAEKAGVPSVSVVATGFLLQGRAIAAAEGIPDLALAEYPGVILTDSQQELQRKVEQVLLDNIGAGLAKPSRQAATHTEPAPRDIIFKGNLEEVNELFLASLWSDGLPIIPPTLDKVERFLKFTERPPEQVIGVLRPEVREATIWNIAVNGVMAGCRPEYMPVLVAVVEAIAEAEFRIQDAGSTPGWEPLIILSGRLVRELDFNCESGMMRIGKQANSSVGRFLRLYMRNVAGLRAPPGTTDKGSIAQNFNVVLAENEDAVTDLGWPPFRVDRGFSRNDNVVTVQSVVSISNPTYSAGSTALEHLETIAEVIGKRAVAYWTPSGTREGKFFPVLAMSPSIAGVIARDGWTKDDIRRYLYENVKEPAGLLEKLYRQRGPSNFSFCAMVEEGIAPPVYCESTDPNRLVPVFLRPEWIEIVVSGDPGRNQSKGYVPNHAQGPPVSKKVELPARWEQMLESARPRQSR